MAGNAAGTIPAWDGGLTKPVAGFQAGGHYSDPFKADKILFTITAANAEQYKNQLSPGQIALLKKYPTWKMNVYPTRRSAAFPKGVYDETAANVGVAKLSPGGNGVTGAKGGIPFLAPKDGLEAIWNSTLRYRGDTYAMKWGQAAVTREGTYTMVNFDYEYDFNYGNLSKPAKDREDNKLAYFLQTVTGPARLASQILLVYYTVDQVKEPRSAWTYNPGQRLVRLAPQVAYDNPGTASDSLRTSDDFQMYNGATDRYNWKLVGKQEMFIPYNSYKLLRQRGDDRGRAAAESCQPRLRALRTAPCLGRRGEFEGRYQPHLQEARLLHRRVQLVDRRDLQVLHAPRAVARVRAAFDYFLLHTHALRYCRGAPSTCSRRAICLCACATTSPRCTRESSATGGFHAGRPARSRHSLSRADPERRLERCGSVPKAVVIPGPSTTACSASVRRDLSARARRSCRRHGSGSGRERTAGPRAG